MALPLESFVKQLADSGLLAGDTIKDFLPPKASPKDAQELARDLVRNKKLTRFQAEEAYKGKAKSLVLGNYVLMEKIGAGGMGQVFKAEHRRMHRTVAIKILPPGMMKDAAAIARFEREVTAAARLRHPNIVAADDADCANGVHFLVMELVEGSDLSALVKKNGRFSVAQAVKYILQAAQGLEFAHHEGVVHRDIKPANLLLDKKGTVKILDLGLARLQGDSDGSPQAELTSTGTVMGTVDYMAPEQALDTKTADARADIYALGCSLHYLLTGKATYDGDSLMAKLLAHRDQPIPVLRETCSDISDEVEAVFTKMVAKAVQDRYQTMTEVIAALEGCAPRQDSSISTGPSLGPSIETGMTDFLQGISIATPKSVQKQKVAGPLGIYLQDKKKLLLIGGSVLGVLVLLTGLFVMLQTKGGTRVPQENRLVEKKKPRAFETAEFKNWMKSVAEMSAEKQVDAVSKKLRELNPGFDGKVTPTIQQGVVKTVQVGSDSLIDISPVRAFPGLEILQCSGKNLADLSPLAGMRLRDLHCEYTQVTDLTPLAGMPLTHLRFGVTPVSDLSPLKGMPLTHLSFMGTAVSDLAPLKDMKLISLECFGTQVADLSPLKGMPLAFLHCHVNPNLVDLAPLKGMPLQNLNCDFQPQRDTQLLRSIKTLEFINIKTAAEFWKEVEEQQGKKPLAIKTPGFDQWIKDVAAMPADKQVAAVSQKLVDLNPGFDGKLTPTTENDVLTGLRFLIDHVTDISPVRALAGLNALHCVASSPGKGKLVDLSPLQGMRLTTLTVSGTPVTDLSPLKEMQLTALDFANTQVTNLSPLAGMPLTTLHFFGTAVTDISPLTGMKLTFLHCPGTKISDLSPLTGMPLSYLAIFGTDVTDLSPLAGAKLTYLHCGGTKVADLSPLEGMPLTSLDFHETNVTNISPLNGMKLTYLNCCGTKIAELSPLTGMPLTSLDFHNTNVTDISPLVGMPLGGLNMSVTQITDLSALKDLPLKLLDLDFDTERHTEILRSIKTLETINRKPAAEFWREAKEQQ